MTQTIAARGHWPATFTALRYPNFRRWFLGQTLSLMGTWMQMVAQGWLVYELTGSKLALGTIAFIGTVPSLFLMLPAGAVADRFPRRRLLIFTQSIMMMFAFILAILAGTGVLQVWHIAVVAFCVGITRSFDAPTRQALAVDMVEDRRDLQNAIALNSSIFNMARIAGPAIGGIILATLGAVWCFAINGLSFLAVLIALSGMRLPDGSGRSQSEPLLAQVKVGLRYVWDNSVVKMVIMLLGMSALFGLSYSVLMPVFAVDVLHVGEAGLGGLNAAVGIGALVGSLTVATLSRNRHKGLQLTLGSLLFPIALIGFALSRSLVLSLICLSAVGLGLVTQTSTSNSLVQSIVPDALRGRVMGIYTLVFFGSAPLGSLFIGALAQGLGPANAVIICAGLSLLFALLIFFAVPSLHRFKV